MAEMLMSRSNGVGRWVRGVAFSSLLMGAAACSDAEASEPVGTPAAPAATISTTIAPTTTAAAAVAETTVATVPPVDPNAVLQQGLAAMAGGCHFSSTVSVSGVQSLLAEGDSVGGSSRLLLTGGGGTVQYIITPQASYAQPEGGEWSLLDVAPATSDAIVALQSPVGVVALATTDGSVLVRATVGAVALGITAEGNVDVDVALVNGVITQITYSSTVDGGTAQVVTTISPLVDTTPITAPI